MHVQQILLIVAAVIYVIARRFAGSPVGGKSMLLPLALAGYGLYEMSGDRHVASLTSIALLAVEALLSVGAGAARAVTIKLYPHEGHLWQRYTFLTLAVWIGMIALRFGFLAAGRGLGASLPETATAMFTFGLSMVIESLLVSRRAAATGVAIMPRQSRRSSASVR
jgi:hypothetical protein